MLLFSYRTLVQTIAFRTVAVSLEWAANSQEMVLSQQLPSFPRTLR